MTPSDRQIGQALTKVRAAHGFGQRYIAATRAGMPDHMLMRREQEGVPLRVAELLAMAEAWGIHPIAMLWELLEECDHMIWDKAAAKLGCPPAQAKDRINKAANQRCLTPWQIWLKLEKDQIKV